MSYLNKDQNKFAECNKLISRGVVGSSSNKYAVEDTFNLGYDNINTQEYSSEDIVAVSVNGTRKDRLSFDKQLVKNAFDSGAIIVADNSYDRNRSFNVGERELYHFLVNELGAKYYEAEIDSGVIVGNYIKK